MTVYAMKLKNALDRTIYKYLFFQVSLIDHWNKQAKAVALPVVQTHRAYII